MKTWLARVSYINSESLFRHEVYGVPKRRIVREFLTSGETEEEAEGKVRKTLGDTPNYTEDFKIVLYEKTLPIEIF